ncbi:MAG: hypothetical protein Q8Q06_00685 [bacterium]|nr:hypothetical protein [bacterium]
MAKRFIFTVVFSLFILTTIACVKKAEDQSSSMTLTKVDIYFTNEKFNEDVAVDTLHNVLTVHGRQVVYDRGFLEEMIVRRLSEQKRTKSQFYIFIGGTAEKLGIIKMGSHPKGESPIEI